MGRKKQSSSQRRYTLAAAEWPDRVPAQNYVPAWEYYAVYEYSGKETPEVVRWTRYSYAPPLCNRPNTNRAAVI